MTPQNRKPQVPRPRTIVLSAAASLAVIGFATPAHAWDVEPTSTTSTTEFHKITICHHSENDAYETITIDNQGELNGHLQHEEDLIPAPEEGCPVPSTSTSEQSTSTSDDDTTSTVEETTTEAEPLPCDNPQTDSRPQCATTTAEATTSTTAGGITGGGQFSDSTTVSDVTNNLIPAVSLTAPVAAELPHTGFEARWAAGIGVFVLLLGCYLMAVRKRWAS